jgi:hypothetical protein
MLDPIAYDHLNIISPRLRYAIWDLHFCLIPRRCILTDKLIWLTDCFKGTVKLDHRGRTEIFYFNKEEFLVWSLKNNV